MNTPCPTCGADRGTPGPCPAQNDPMQVCPPPPSRRVIGLGREIWFIDPATDIASSTRASSAKEVAFDQLGLNAQLQTLGEWCLKRAREQHNTATTRSMLRRKVDQILSPRPLKPGGR